MYIFRASESDSEALLFFVFPLIHFNNDFLIDRVITLIIVQEARGQRENNSAILNWGDDMMEWLERLNEAINFIEEHLTDGIDLDRVAQIACCSAFHFQRMFSYVADVPLAEYIRRRKMTKAAFDLQHSNDKIAGIALKYGYYSPTSFNRAFQSVHGIAPSAARTEGMSLKTYPPISFKLTVKGFSELNYRIEKKSAFRIVGITEHYALNIEDGFDNVPSLWQKAKEQEIIPVLASMIDNAPFGVLGVSTCMDGKVMDYFISVSTDKETPVGMVEYTIPECTWAIFECIGALPDAIQNLYRRIMNEWLPASGYEYADAPDIEVYFNGNQQDNDYRCEVWLPLITK